MAVMTHFFAINPVSKFGICLSTNYSSWPGLFSGSWQLWHKGCSLADGEEFRRILRRFAGTGHGGDG
jgi:hypothetical protein